VINLLLFSLLLQDPAPIRVTTRMVEVGVAVHSRDGRPVTGLRAEDFRLLDGETEEPIRSFSAADRERLANPAESHVSTAILLDYFNSMFEKESFGRSELLRFLNELEPRHPVALLSLDRGFQVLHDFTTDAQSLARALARHRPYRPMQSAAFRPVRFHGKFSTLPANTPIDKMDSQASSYYRALRVRETASAMGALAAFLASRPGRKNLIWISSTFPYALAASVRSDDVAVYPIDVRTPIDGPCPEARMLAERTGGVAFDHGNSVINGLRDSYRDGAAVYLLGYYPSHQRWDGGFRPIRVLVKRGDAVLRHRDGYRAARDDSFRPPDDREVLWHVAASPAEARGLLVTAKAERLKDGPVQVALNVDAQTLALGDPAAGGKNELELMLVPVRGNGEVLDGEYCKLHVDGTPGVRERILKDGFRAMQAVTTPPDARKLRVVVREVRTGALGSATADLGRPK
jgi:VWFA-related protein